MYKQDSLFPIEVQAVSLKRLDMPDAEVIFYEGFFTQDESDVFLQQLIAEIAWEEIIYNFYGKKVVAPRLVAWYGDEGKNYSYSGITHTPHAWTPGLLSIKNRIEAAAATNFNSVLLNYYRNGSDSMGWHSDDEPELGSNPIIGSVSFGNTRAFHFKHKQQANLQTSVALTHGSLLVMRGPTQHFWKHGISKTRQPTEARINLTFRTILG